MSSRCDQASSRGSRFKFLALYSRVILDGGAEAPGQGRLLYRSRYPKSPLPRRLVTLKKPRTWSSLETRHLNSKTQSRTLSQTVRGRGRSQNEDRNLVEKVSNQARKKGEHFAFQRRPASATPARPLLDIISSAGTSPPRGAKLANYKVSCIVRPDAILQRHVRAGSDALPGSFQKPSTSANHSRSPDCQGLSL